MPMSTRYQDDNPFASGTFEDLKKFITRELESPVDGRRDGFEQFEKKLHKRIMAFEAELVGKRLQQYDLDVDEVEVFGERFRRKDEFEKEVRQDIVQFLRKKLKNSRITIELAVKQDDGEKGTLYTAEEKFDHMNKKNPYLGKLKQQFNLDFELSFLTMTRLTFKNVYTLLSIIANVPPLE